MLQAARGGGDAHRVANYNFGPWESWSLNMVDHRLRNLAFPDKTLGWRVEPVAPLLYQSMLLDERARNHDSRLMGAAVRTAEVRRAKTAS